MLKLSITISLKQRAQNLLERKQSIYFVFNYHVCIKPWLALLLLLFRLSTSEPVVLPHSLCS